MAITRRRLILTTGAAAGAAAIAPLVRSGEQPAAAQPTTKPDLSSWSSVREQWILDPSYAHLALFFISSHPKPVRDAVERHRREIDTNPYLTVEHGLFAPGPENHMMSSAAALARYIGGDMEDIALTDSTSGALSAIYMGLPLRRGDEILTTTDDHYVHHEAIRIAAERAAGTWRKIRMFDSFDAISQDGIVDRLRSSVRPQTRVLGVTWVHSSTGVKLPLEKLAAAVREINAKRPASDRLLLIVDGVHGLAAEPSQIATTGIDAFASGLHKWMFAPRGTGFAWAKPDVWASMRPATATFSAEEPYVAWMQNREMKGQPRGSWFSPAGFQAYEHFWAIADAIAFQEAIGPARSTKRIHELNRAAKEGLAAMSHVKVHTPLSDDLSAGVICFDVDGMKPEQVVARLFEKRIIASTSPYVPTYARLSFGIPNTEAEVERALAAVRELT